MRALMKIGALLLIVFGFYACNQQSLLISVSNPTDADRLVETVKVKLNKSKLDATELVVVDKASGTEVQSQLIDEDVDGVNLMLAFQVRLKANETREYIVKEGQATIIPGDVKTFGRFVPERTDDFAWENDKVAFRVYGPEAQRLFLSGEKGGTYSGGVDCWLKKVDYSIIDKWYAGNSAKPGYYHKDHGEGLDNYHVGPSLGCGGTGVMIGEELQTSFNYTAYKVLNNGPIETKFELAYAPFGKDNTTVMHSKTVSIDLGSNLSKFIVSVEGADVLTTGLTLHDNKGKTSVDSTACWAGYWSPHMGEELGTAIVVDPKYYAGSSKVVVDEKDKSHLLVHLKPINGKVEYYAGFAWSGSKQFANKQAWHGYLEQFAYQLKYPLKVSFK